MESYGADASLSFRPIDQLALTVFGSYTRARLQDDLFLGTAAGVAVFAPTAGKQVTETPEFQVGGRAQVTVGPLEVGGTGEDVGERRTFIQLNVDNLLDTFYYGNISTQTNAGTINTFAGANPSFSVGSPRTVSAGLNIAF